MIAKTGDVVIWHWAHESANPHCSSAGESEWHLTWKTEGLDGTQEIARGNRRADVLAPGGFAVEFQKSALSGAEVRAREADWGGRLVWIFDAREAWEGERIWLHRHPEKDADDVYRKIRWSHAPERVWAGQCRVILDLGEGNLLYLGKWWDDSSPLRGYGWLVSYGWVVANVVRGLRIPQVPYGKVIKVADMAAWNGGSW
jgi:hypothetical protein